MIKCLSHIQLKMIPKNVKNHSKCAIGITSPEATEEVISFRHCRTIDNVFHGRENESCEFFISTNVYLLTFMLSFPRMKSKWLFSVFLT